VSRSSAGTVRTSLGAAWAVLTAWLGLAGSDPVPAATAWPEPPSVEWAHCTVLRHGSTPVCSYDPKDPVRLWVDHPRAAEARVRIDGAVATAEPYWLEAEPHGQGLRVAIPPGSHALELEVPDDEGPRIFGLMLEQQDPNAAPVGEAELAEAIASWKTKEVAWIERASLRAAEAIEAAGRASDAVFLLCAASFYLRGLRAFDAAERLLARAETMGSAFAVGRMTVSNYRGQLSWSKGALHEAAVQLREGARLSLRLEDGLSLVDALPIYAEALAELGYYEEARHWAGESLRHPPATGCDRATLMRTTAWIDLVLRARDQPHDDPRPRLERAIELYRTNARCAHEQSGPRLSLALLAFGDGDVATARRELEAIDTATLSAEDRVRAADLRVRVRLQADADPASVWRAWDELQAAARVVDDDDARWRVEVRRGELLARDRDAAGALVAFERAEQHLDRLVRAQAVVGVGLTATADRYLEGTTALVSLLVEEGRDERAFCVARQARARRRSAAIGVDGLPAAARAQVLAKIDRYHELKRLAEHTEGLVLARPQGHEPALRHEAERASRAASELVNEIVEELVGATASPRCEQLVPPQPGELLLGIYPRDSDWLLLAQDDERHTSVHGVTTPSEAELADPQVLAERLLEPVAGSLEVATRVRVLADRQAQGIDVHLLPWRGEPLSARVPVTYGVELPMLPASPGADARSALLLADPTGTLASARAEVGEVAERLKQAGWAVVVPPTDDPEAPLEPSFAGYSLLHYAAHTATRRGSPQVWAPYPAGEAGGLPHLQIGPLARLEVHDILALRPVPPVAFLAGCKTGLVELDAGSTSVALAFLLADGQQVVASRENVDDAAGLEIARRFYARFGRGAGMDAAMAMHETQRELWQERPQRLVPYRVWVR
jgi:tetratricopeptide (TPR) repeat protein